MSEPKDDKRRYVVSLSQRRVIDARQQQRIRGLNTLSHSARLTPHLSHQGRASRSAHSSSRSRPMYAPAPAPAAPPRSAPPPPPSSPPTAAPPNPPTTAPFSRVLSSSHCEHPHSSPNALTTNNQLMNFIYLSVNLRLIQQMCSSCRDACEHSLQQTPLRSGISPHPRSGISTSAGTR